MGRMEPAPKYRLFRRPRPGPAGVLLASLAGLSILLYSRSPAGPAARFPLRRRSRAKSPDAPAASIPAAAAAAAPGAALVGSERREAVIDVRDALAVSPRPVLPAASPVFGSPDFREYRFHSYQPPYRSDWLHAVTGSVYNRGDGKGVARVRVTARVEDLVRFETVVDVVPSSSPLPAMLGESARSFGSVPASEYQASDDVLSAISDINREESPRVLFRSGGGRRAVSIAPHSEGRFHVVFECICRAEAWRWSVELEEE